MIAVFHAPQLAAAGLDKEVEAAAVGELVGLLAGLRGLDVEVAE